MFDAQAAMVIGGALGLMAAVFVAAGLRKHRIRRWK